MDRKMKMSVGIGGPSILMIFVVLSLTTLAALSLMTANADWKLTQKSADAITDYYSADSNAEEILASSDASFKEGRTLMEDSFTIPASDTQNLILRLGITGSGYSVVLRKLVPKTQWDYDQYQTEFNDALVE